MDGDLVSINVLLGEGAVIYVAFGSPNLANSKHGFVSCV